MQFLAPIISLLLCFVAAHASAQEWQLHKDEQQIRLYSRTTDTGRFEVKLETEVKAHPKSLALLLDDTERAKLWIANCRKVETLDWFGDKARTVQSYFSSPWPLKDRDMVTHSTMTYDKQAQRMVIEIKDVGRAHPPLPHYQRMEDISGRWVSERTGPDSTLITYVGSGNAAGSVPDFLAHTLLKRYSFITFEKMRVQIVRPMYQPSEITE